MADINQMMGYPNSGGGIRNNYYGGNNSPQNNPYVPTDPYNRYMNNQPNMGIPNPQQNQMGGSNNIQFLKCRPVSSEEEARASQIDLDGSLWVFTDVGNGRIYTKQINNNGIAVFNTYQYVKNQNPYMGSSVEYVTKEEFNETIQKLIAAMQVQNPQEPASTTELANNKIMDLV